MEQELVKAIKGGYDFYLNIDNNRHLQGILKNGDKVISLPTDLLDYLFSFSEDKFIGTLSNSKYLKVSYENYRYILRRYAILFEGIYGARSKYGVEKELVDSDLFELLAKYGSLEDEDEIRKVL